MRCILLNNLMPQDTEVADRIGIKVHGCDICQEVCPRNARVFEDANRTDPFLEAVKSRINLENLLFFDDEYYDEVIHPLMYNYIKDKNIFRRNAARAMGNSGDPAYIPALERAIAEFPDTIVEAAARKALDQLR